ncbi:MULTISPECIES: flagellar assembly peptidoglycan hydrolase FlgJ [unclassified Modicisalibacter]|uniref:flagellar assembly peptidoglycan hydrolase FlgJ n=1 Tax=unclassified Modicisalibacter TaxID=2679913 RepID=UPI001CCAF243|nr:MULTISPECIES: flagellar assembly peptidoglycan hydrolase FlgJ [unclassified Modicisalibacter]MBZ9556991.1 flagellar assembly peptidoglycan hydrolase FlgJ [Modicisalibacter sp. R2A 31.J]MBZ9574295.1 flagellar assembly peptidoglycan hydrolase FlgJ [Modicisalibacter sp. MOD 31.J]
MAMQDMGSQFALDMQGLQRLKHTASVKPQEGARAAAKQFEAIFIQMMLKSMREATPKEGLLDNQQTELYTSMYDQQLAQTLSGRGLGFADMLVQQLQHRGLVPGDADRGDSLIAGIPHGTPRVLTGGLIAGETAATASSDTRSETARRFIDDLAFEPDAGAYETNAVAERNADRHPAHVAEFLEQLSEPARAASRTTGVPAELILAQAALETGWGRHEIPTAEGGNSHNLFGIKAGSQWQGRTTDVTTTEYVDGRPVKMVDTFRVYDDFEQAFTDYARLIGDNPRYAGVVAAGNAEGAARSLQAGGYATDPAYADKLIAVMHTMGFDATQRTARLEPGESAQVAGRDPSAALDAYALDKVPTRIF